MRQSITISRVCGTLSKRVDQKILSRNDIISKFYRREETRGAQIRALVPTILSQRICRELFSPQMATILWTRIHWKPMDFMWLDYGFWSKSSTSSNSSSELPTSLRMSRHVFNTYSARSRDSRGPYTAKLASRDRKTPEKVGEFAFWPTRRCVRPYIWNRYAINKNNVEFSSFSRTNPVCVGLAARCVVFLQHYDSPRS